jgi:transcriptional regulator with XRE-family HTH domain
MKQNEAAEKLGISKSYLSEIERHHKEPSLDLLKKYESTFGIPMSSIMFFAENIGQSPSKAKAKAFAASKIINLMQFIEQRSGRIDVSD